MRVLVVGGGMAGMTACTSLRKFDKSVEIVVVDPKEYMEVHWASVRNIFDEGMAARSIFAIDKWAVSKSIKVIRDRVTSLTPREATLSDGTVIEFHAAVVCTGAQTRLPALGRGPPSTRTKAAGDRDRRLAQLAAEGSKYLSARSVLIVGGGLVGVEFAGDLAYYARANGKSIKMTLVHSGNRLCPEMSPKAAEMVKFKLENLGVQVLLCDRATQEGSEVRLQSTNKLLDAEQVVWTTGLRSCSNFLGREYLDEKGWIKVDDYFRVVGAEQSLFALGDCCDLLPNAGSQILGTMAVIGKNIAVTLDALQTGNQKKIEKKLRKALVQPEAYVTTIGRQTGVAQLPCCYTQVLLPMLKNNTMFLFKPKGQLALR